MVNEFDFLRTGACRVTQIPHLSLEIVAYAEAQTSVLPLARSCIKRPGEVIDVIVLTDSIACFRVYIGQGSPTVECCTLFRRIGERERRGDNVSDCLQTLVLAEIEQSIEPCTHRNATGIGLANTKCSELFADFSGRHTGSRHKFSLVVVFRFNELELRRTEMPVHSVTYARSDVYVFEQGEIRQTDLEIVGHTVLHLVPESRLSEFS